MSGRVPWPVGVGAAVATSIVVLPIAALVGRAPWTEVARTATSEVVRDALVLSLICSLGATALSIGLGTPLAWVLARARFPGRRLLRAVATLPMVLPPVVGGVALLLAFGRRGPVGSLLDQWFGIRLGFTTAGAVLAETFVAMPFFVIAAEAAFRGVDRQYEDSARSLGGGPIAVFARVTLPLARPGLLAGAVLCWARALGEFGATVTFAGSLPGETRTIPLAVYLALDTNPAAAITLSLVLLAVSVVVLVALRERWLGAPAAS